MTITIASSQADCSEVSFGKVLKVNLTNFLLYAFRCVNKLMDAIISPTTLTLMFVNSTMTVILKREVVLDALQDNQVYNIGNLAISLAMNIFLTKRNKASI